MTQFVILEYGKHQLLGIYDSIEAANNICDALNTKRTRKKGKDGKAVYVYTNRYTVAKAGVSDGAK